MCRRLGYGKIAPPTMTAPNRKATRFVRARKPPAPVPWDEVLANLTDAVIIISPDGTILACNPASEDLLGLPESQLRGRPHRAVFATSPAVIDLLRRSQELGQTQTLTEEPLTIAGRAIPARIAISPLFGHGGKPRGAVLVVHDLQYQSTLQEDAGRAERLAQLGQLAAGLAHEIRNPLGGIRGAAQLLRREFPSEARVQEYADLLIKETDRLTSLVEQVLALGSPRPPECRLLNVHRLIDEVLLLARETPAANGVSVQCAFDPSLPPIRGDERQLKQVLLNLISNALQALNGGGRMTLTTRMETDFHIVRAPHGSAKFIRIEVADNGEGIAEENLPHIFDPFFTTKNRGTGLGLAISHRLVTANGGTLRAARRPGGGTLMTLSLPAALESA